MWAGILAAFWLTGGVALYELTVKKRAPLFMAFISMAAWAAVWAGGSAVEVTSGGSTLRFASEAVPPFAVGMVAFTFLAGVFAVFGVGPYSDEDDEDSDQDVPDLSDRESVRRHLADGGTERRS